MQKIELISNHNQLTTMSPATLLEKWFEQVWNNANEDFIDERLNRNVIVHGLDPAVTTIGILNFKKFYKNFRESFPVVQFVWNYQ